MHGNVPEGTCEKIEEALNIGDIYAIGLVSQGIILSNVVIMLRKGEIIEHEDLIEAYIRKAGINCSPAMEDGTNIKRERKTLSKRFREYPGCVLSIG